MKFKKIRIYKYQLKKEERVDLFKYKDLTIELNMFSRSGFRINHPYVFFDNNNDEIVDRDGNVYNKDDFIRYFELDHPYFFIKNNYMVARKGYCWDGPSGPSYDSEVNMRASLFHDLGYQLIRRGDVSASHRKLFDLLLYYIMLEDSEKKYKKNKIKLFFAKIRAKYYYLAVKLFGEKHCIPGDNEDELNERL